MVYIFSMFRIETGSTVQYIAADLCFLSSSILTMCPGLTIIVELQARAYI